MEYREFRVGGRWAGVVEAGWAAGIPAGGPALTDAVLPDGCMDVLWTGRELLVAGPDTAPHPYLREPGLVACGLRFAPGQLPGRLGLPAAELRDQRVPLTDLHPRLAAAAADRLAAAAGPREALTVLADVAAALPHDRADPALAALVARLRAADTTDTAVAAVADSLGWTTRTLHRRCVAAFGYGPAVLRRILRFRRATDLLSAGVRPADVAALAGYADQPHLSRELRALGDTSPARLVAAGRFSRSVPVPPQPVGEGATRPAQDVRADPEIRLARSSASPGQLDSGANRSTPLPSGSRTVA